MMMISRPILIKLIIPGVLLIGIMVFCVAWAGSPSLSRTQIDQKLHHCQTDCWREQTTCVIVQVLEGAGFEATESVDSGKLMHQATAICRDLKLKCRNSCMIKFLPPKKSV